MKKILFLDYDGVLHPGNIWFVNGEFQLIQDEYDQDESLSLFCWAPILEKILCEVDPEGQIDIVLSTSWSHRTGWRDASKRLPHELQKRVLGGTTGYQQPRGRQIEMYVEDMRLDNSHWIALDDDDYFWPERILHKLVRTDKELGISEASVQQQLRVRLEELLLM